jgi:hypothetical protein
MNGINQMIAQGIQPPKFESPLNQFAQVETDSSGATDERLAAGANARDRTRTRKNQRA